LPVSSNTSFSVSPLSRLTPLNDASCAVAVIQVLEATTVTLGRFPEPQP
jgi:hypothetical protein